MKIFQSAIFFAFLLVTFSLSSYSQSDSRVSKTWEVQKYDVTATLPTVETDRYLNTKAVLTLKNTSSSSASNLTLRISPSAEISAVKINNSATDFTKGEEKIGNGTLQRIVLRGVSTPAGGNVSVEVNYKLKVAENSGLNALSPNGAQFLPLSFWYPTPNSWYFARGADFAPVHLQIVAPNGQTVVSSGTQSANLFDLKINGQPFFVSGDWDSVMAANVSVLIPKGATAQNRANELANLVSEAKTFTANLLGNAPETPLRIAAVRRGGGFSSGGTILIDESVFRRQKIDSQTAMTVAEAVAKMWLGNVVQTNGDGYSVIREGLSRFIATQFIESKYGKEIADVERMRQRNAFSSIVKRGVALNAVSPLDDYYFTANANKGSMIWRLLAKKIGQSEFFNIVKENMKDGNLELSELRTAFSGQKVFLDNAIDQPTDTNLIIGLPSVAGGETKIALRNSGSFEATVNVVATTANGEKLNAQSTIPAKSFGEVIFKTSNKIVRAEIDVDKLYPQTDYFDDVSPRQFEDSDLLLSVKKVFDKQEFANAEKIARSVLQIVPNYDDVRILLARALLSQGKNAEAQKEFQTAFDEKLPTARTLAWANVGFGEIALKSGQNSNAIKFFEEVIKADAEYGASLIARQNRNKINLPNSIDEAVKSYFAQFDKTAVSNRKSEIEAVVSAGEAKKFAAGIAGQTEKWQTQVIQIDKLDANNVLVEANLSVKLLNRAEESGMAVYRLTKTGSIWKLSNVEMFEVR
jgi:tetratricopeptide (TPR) repeat protein